MGKAIKRIVSSAPLRINDIGGWTDTWFSREGHVLNMAVSPCVKVNVAVFENLKKRPDRVKVFAVDYGEVFHIDPEKPDYTVHPLIQGAVNSVPIPEAQSIDITIRSSVPAGSAVGTSASVCVALLGALDALLSKRRPARAIAALAHQVEAEKLRLQSGIQDQISSAYGGVCDIVMPEYPAAEVRRIYLDKTLKETLNRQLCLIYLGHAHSSSDIHEYVIRSLKKKGSHVQHFKELRNLAEEGAKTLRHEDLAAFGRVMVRNNELQRALHSDLISRLADAVISVAKKYGALGWKVNGAGGQGGSLTILSSQDRDLRHQMLNSIRAIGQGVRHIPIKLSLRGLMVRSD